MDMKLAYLVSDIIGCIIAVNFCMNTSKPLSLVLGILYLVTLIGKWFTCWLLKQQ